MSKYPFPVFGWSAPKLADHSFEQLNAIRLVVEAEGLIPVEKRKTIYIYTREARRKLDALAWAVAYKMNEKKAGHRSA